MRIIKIKRIIQIFQISLNRWKENSPFWNENSQQGIALLMVMGAITILTALFVNFTFDTKINKLRAYHKQERIQAKLNAESGLNLSLARLKLFKEALVLLEKNKDKSNLFDQKSLDLVWSFPLIFPIPVSKKADIIQKTAVEDFEKESYLQGNLRVSIDNISQLININLLRLSKKNKEDESPQDQLDGQDSDSTDDNSGQSDDALSAIGAIQDKLIQLLSQKFKQKREEIEDFEDKYTDYEPEFLIKAIKYYVNDEGKFQDVEESELSLFYEKIKPKFGPLSSLSELYLIHPLNDAIIDMLKEDITVHGKSTIDLNKLTKNGLKLMFADITEEQIKEFFEFRDDPDEPHYFKSLEDFKDYIVRRAQIVDDGDFNKTIDEFQKAGVNFGTKGHLFKIISQGLFGESSYTIEAIVNIPTKTQPPPPNRPKNREDKCDEGFELEKNPKNPQTPCRATQKKDANGKPIPPPLIYLEPRVIEITTK